MTGVRIRAPDVCKGFHPGGTDALEPREKKPLRVVFQIAAVL